MERLIPSYIPNAHRGNDLSIAIATPRLAAIGGLYGTKVILHWGLPKIYEGVDSEWERDVHNIFWIRDRWAVVYRPGEWGFYNAYTSTIAPRLIINASQYLTALRYHGGLMNEFLRLLEGPPGNSQPRTASSYGYWGHTATNGMSLTNSQASWLREMQPTHPTYSRVSCMGGDMVNYAELGNSHRVIVVGDKDVWDVMTELFEANCENIPLPNISLPFASTTNGSMVSPCRDVTIEAVTGAEYRVAALFIAQMTQEMTALSGIWKYELQEDYKRNLLCQLAKVKDRHNLAGRNAEVDLQVVNRIPAMVESYNGTSAYYLLNSIDDETEDYDSYLAVEFSRVSADGQSVYQSENGRIKETSHEYDEGGEYFELGCPCIACGDYQANHECETPEDCNCALCAVQRETSSISIRETCARASLVQGEFSMLRNYETGTMVNWDQMAEPEVAQSVESQNVDLMDAQIAAHRTNNIPIPASTREEVATLLWG